MLIVLIELIMMMMIGGDFGRAGALRFKSEGAHVSIMIKSNKQYNINDNKYQHITINKHNIQKLNNN